MSVRSELESTLAAGAADRREADSATAEIFDSVIAALRRRFPDIGRDDLELTLGDARRDAGELLDLLISNTIELDTAVNLVAQRIFGED